jgi:exopolysaccharide biosynthesis polyprenyl glycosylphosphotransferase
MELAKAALEPSVQWASIPRARGFKTVSRWQIIMRVQGFDLLIILAASAISYRMWVADPGISYCHYWFTVLLVAAACFLSCLEGHLYDIDQLLDEALNAKATILRWTLIFAVLAAVASLAREPLLLSRLWFASFYLIGGVLLVAHRCASALLIRNWVRGGNVVKSVVIAGVNDLKDKLVAKFEHGLAGIRVAGIFDMSADVRPAGQAGRSVCGVPVLGGIDDLLVFTKLTNPDLVILTLPVADTGQLKEVIRRLRQQPLNIRLVPGEIALDQTPSIQLSRRELPGVQLITVANRPISRAGLLIKDVIDRLAAAAALILLAPCFLVVAGAIAIASPGPVFFRQTRVGYNGREFRIFKFRTMHHEFSGSYAATVKGDSRVFWLGRWLRRSSIDELPQLLNVLKGDMTLVGPRPHMVAQRLQDQRYFEDVDRYIAWHRVKPGITGWAQVKWLAGTGTYAGANWTAGGA